MINFKEEVEKSRASMRPFHFIGGHNFEIDWQKYHDIFSHIYSKIDITCKCDDPRHSSVKFYGHTKNNESAIFVLNNFDPVITGCNSLDIGQKIFDYLTNIGIESGIKLISNFVGHEHNNGIHPDDRDVYSFHLFGNVEYRIYPNFPAEKYHTGDSDGHEYISYFLKPGDIVYIPKGLVHQAVVSEPRITAIADVWNI